MFLGIDVEYTSWFKTIQATKVCLKLFNAEGLLLVFVCFDADICRVICLFVCFFSQKIYLVQSCRGISGDIFAYILHTEAYDFAYPRRHSPRYLLTLKIARNCNI